MPPAITPGVDALTQYLTQLGATGIVAALIFFFYRRDFLKTNDTLKQQNELLIQVVRENSASNASVSASNATLTSAVEALHRRLDNERFPPGWRPAAAGG